MNQSKRSTLPAVVPCVLALAALLPAQDGRAATERVQRTSATAACEAPLPVYDTTLRKRPVGILNEGRDPVFVSCSLPADSAAGPGGATISVRFAMSGGAPATSVQCQLVTGTPDNLVFTAGSTTVAAAGGTWLTWNGVDKRAATGTINFSCNLPSKVDMTTIMYRETSAANGL